MSVTFEFENDVDCQRAVRSYLSVLPDDWVEQVSTGGPLKVVVCLHDSNSDADRAASLMRFHEIPAQSKLFNEKFVTIYPNAESGLLSPAGQNLPGLTWNDGHVRPDSMPPDNLAISDPDVQFIYAAIADTRARMQQAYNAQLGFDDDQPEVIDEDNFFLVGLGGGGAMAYRMAAQVRPIEVLGPGSAPLYFQFRAVAVVGGTIGGAFHHSDFSAGNGVSWSPTNRKPALPKIGSIPKTSIMHVHGDNDLDFEPGAEGSFLASVSSLSSARYENMTYTAPDLGTLSRLDLSMSSGLESWVTHNGFGVSFAATEQSVGYTVTATSPTLIGPILVETGPLVGTGTLVEPPPTIGPIEVRELQMGIDFPSLLALRIRGAEVGHSWVRFVLPYPGFDTTARIWEFFKANAA